MTDMTMPVGGAVTITTLAAGTRARTDLELLASWIDGLASAHSRRNFEATVLRFLEALPCTLREAKVEDVRLAIATISDGRSAGTTRQYVLRIKGFLAYGHRLGYLPFNAGAVLRVKGRRAAPRSPDASCRRSTWCCCCAPRRSRAIV